MLIREYALEPTVICNWDRFQRFIGHFGIQHGRLISRYPKRWKQMVIDALSGCADVERLRIVERLRTVDDRLLPRQHDWNPGMSWVANAESEHGIRPFHAIIAGTNPHRHDFVLVSDELDETNPPPHWKAQRSRIVRREAEQMAQAVALLLRMSKKIVLIDPHFGPENGRHRATLEHFLVAVLQDRAIGASVEVAVHTGDKASFAFFESECRARLAPLIPMGLQVQLIRWKQDQLHNRFILTDLGGVTFLHGLDENQRMCGPDEDLVQLLDFEVCMRILDEYCGASPKYTPGTGAPVLVIGTRAR
jgi:hypothetical protein